MGPSEAAPRAAQYLDQVEQIIGLTFFSGVEQERLARTDLEHLPQSDVRSRAPLYIAGLGLLAAARQRFNLPRHTPPQLTLDQIVEIRQAHQPQVKSIREGLLSLTDIEPPADSLSFAAVQKNFDIGSPILRRTIDELGISQNTVITAIRHVDPGGAKVETTEEGEPIYAGSLLLAIREQLLGIPFDCAARALGLIEQTQSRALAYLRRKGYGIFGDPATPRISPAVFKFLGDNFTAATGMND